MSTVQVVTTIDSWLKNRTKSELIQIILNNIDKIDVLAEGTSVLRPTDTDRVNAIIAAEPDIEKTLQETWRVTAVEEYEDADFRKAIDKLIVGEKQLVPVMFDETEVQG